MTRTSLLVKFWEASQVLSKQVNVVFGGDSNKCCLDLTLNEQDFFSERRVYYSKNLSILNINTVI